MAKKKTYYQAICYTTDHCDGDLIAPACWKPSASLNEAAIQMTRSVPQSSRVRTIS